MSSTHPKSQQSVSGGGRTASCEFKAAVSSNALSPAARLLELDDTEVSVASVPG